MGLRTDVARIARLTRETLLREALRRFPDVTEEELISVLETWKRWRDKTDEELSVYAKTGRWPGEEPD